MLILRYFNKLQTSTSSKSFFATQVGLGGNIAKSLGSECRPGAVPPPAYRAKTEDAGNGSLMRFAPVALFAAGAPALPEMARASSYTTHPGIIAAEACAFLGYILEQALREPAPVDPKRFLDRVCTELSVDSTANLLTINRNKKYHSNY